ncbi:hypothetical protein ES703_09194 [subsurface metagenome]
MSYHCPVCHKVSDGAKDLARHMMGQTDRVHKDWINSKGLSFSKLLIMQATSFGDKGYDTLAELLEKETKVED